MVLTLVIYNKTTATNDHNRCHTTPCSQGTSEPQMLQGRYTVLSDTQETSRGHSEPEAINHEPEDIVGPRPHWAQGI